MSYRKRGICKKCDQPFMESIGHPADWNEWALTEEDMTPLQRWWHNNIALCYACEEPPPAELLAIKLQI
jgi:hypothetical protein